MSQVTSQSVSNGSGAAVRAAMNNIFGALFSASSGATAPTTTVAGQLWFDTGSTPAVLKRRNSANTDWDKVSPGVTTVEKTSGYTVVEADRYSMIRCTSALTLAFDPASDLGTDWMTIIKAEAAITLNPDGSETINGNSTESMVAGDSALIFSDGSNLHWVKIEDVAAAVSAAETVSRLAEVDISSDATVEFTAFDDSLYESYVFAFHNVTPATDGAELQMRTSSDGGSSYDSGASDYEVVLRRLKSGNDSNVATGSGDSELALTRGEVGSSAGETGICGELMIYAPDAAVHTQMTWDLSYITDANTMAMLSGAGRRMSAADVDAVQFLFDSGNLESGKIVMYGIRGA